MTTAPKYIRVAGQLYRIATKPTNKDVEDLYYKLIKSRQAVQDEYYKVRAVQRKAIDLDLAETGGLEEAVKQIAGELYGLNSKYHEALLKLPLSEDDTRDKSEGSTGPTNRSLYQR